MTDRAIEVRIIGDPSSLERALGRGATSLKAFGGDVEKAAAAQVEAGAKQRAELTRLAAEYERVAVAAKKGSDEQIVAAAKASEANRKLAAESRTTNESAVAFNGATAGAKEFLKTSLAFGAGFAGYEGLKKSITTVLDAQASINQLDQAVKNAHASVKALSPVLEEHAAKARELGFSDDQTREAEARLITAFGATKNALGELSDAQDLARTRHEDLATAAQQLILLQEGNTRAAKQFGLALPDLTSKQWEAKAAADGLTISQERGKVLYDELLPRIHAQSEAFANSPSGKVAEFQAQIEHLQEAIGERLLPEVNHYLTAIDGWLAKGDNQKRLTDDINHLIGTLAGVLHDAETAMQDALPYINDVAHALGGWKTVIEAMIALKLADVVSGWAASFTKLAGAEALGAAETKSAGLLGNLNALKLLGPIAIAVTVDEIIKKVTGSGSDFSQGTAADSYVAASIAGTTYYSVKGSSDASDLQRIAAAIRAGKSLTKDEKAFLAQLAAHGYSSKTGAAAPSASQIPASAYANPVPGASYARVDQGVDYVAKSNVLAASGGTIFSVAKGMAGGTGDIIKERLTKPITINGHTYYGIYYSEEKPLVHPGQKVSAGTPVMGPGGNEIGFLDKNGRITALVGGLGAGTKATQAGFDFNTFVMGLGGTGGSTATPYGPPSRSGGGHRTGSTTKTKKTTLPSGDALLPESLRNAIATAKNDATQSEGSAALMWLHTELSDLDDARSNLEHQLLGAKGKHRAAIQQELRSVDTRIADVNKAITTNLKDQAQAIKSAFSSTIGSEKSAISAAAQQIKSDLDAQLQAATQAYIDDVLGPQYYQGTDAHGLQLQTPDETALSTFTTAQAQKQRDDTLAQAQKQLALDQQQSDVTQDQIDQDNAAVQAAKNAITQAKLEADATASRARADHDYADAVKKAQADEAERQKQLDRQLEQWSKGLTDGTTNIGDLAGIAAYFGLTLGDKSSGVIGDLGVLSSAVKDLAATLIAESQKLGGIGDDSDADAARKKAAALLIPSDAPILIPGTHINFAGFVAAALARDALGPIPKLSAGGDILSEGLAYLHAGERVQPAGVVRRGGTTADDGLHVHIHGGTFIGTSLEQAARELKPALDRIVQAGR